MLDLKTKSSAEKENQNKACKVCDSELQPIDEVDLNKACGPKETYIKERSNILVQYWECKNCGFIHTYYFEKYTSKDWLDKIYNQDYYTKVDPDYLDKRPKLNARLILSILKVIGYKNSGLDYGGGSGQTGKLIRLNGYGYDWYDPYGKSELNKDNLGKYEFCSCMEVIEHIINPSEWIEKIIELCSKDRLIILIGTEVRPKNIKKGNLLDWWYVAPRNGHISLYTKKSLEILAKNFEMKYISINKSTHIIFKGYSVIKIFIVFIAAKILNKFAIQEIKTIKYEC